MKKNSEALKKDGKIQVGNLKIIDGDMALEKADITCGEDFDKLDEMNDRVKEGNIKPFDRLNLEELDDLNDLDDTIVNISSSRYTWWEDRIIYKIRYKGIVYHIVIRNIGSTEGQFRIYQLTDESNEGKYEWIYEKDFDITLVHPLFAEAFKGLSEQYQSLKKPVYYFERKLIDTINQILASE
jgi:hypothetical protein